MATWYDEFAKAVAAGEETYRQCNACGAATTPPRTLCPECGKATLEAQPLSKTAEVVSSTDIHVSTPEYADDTPYTVVLAAFEEGITLTGQLRGADGVSPGEAVELDAEALPEGRRILVFRPA